MIRQLGSTILPSVVLVAAGGLGTAPAHPAAAVSPPPSATLDVPEIVERSIAFHGGDRYRHSLIAYDLCSKSGCFAVTTRTDGGLFVHTVEAKNGPDRWARTTNSTVEARRDGEPVALAREEEQSWRDWVMARVYFAVLPFRLTDPSVRYRDLGVVDWEDRSLHRIHISFEVGSSSDASDEYMYWFDPETARLERFAYTYVNQDGSRGLRFRELHNYRRIGGILLFDQINLGREDHLLPLEAITSASVAAQLREVSRVRLENVTVEPVD